MTDERPLSERPAARPVDETPPLAPVAEEPKDPAEQFRRYNRLKIIWGIILAFAVIGTGAGGVLANAGTTFTWICLGSSFECRAIETTPLGSFGIFMEWTCPVLILISFLAFVGYRGLAKEYREKPVAEE